MRVGRAVSYSRLFSSTCSRVRRPTVASYVHILFRAHLIPYFPFALSGLLHSRHWCLLPSDANFSRFCRYEYFECFLGVSLRSETFDPRSFLISIERVAMNLRKHISVVFARKENNSFLIATIIRTGVVISRISCLS